MRDPIFLGSQAINYEDYLALEEKSKTKHEFTGGKIRAMAGGTPKHARLASNTFGRLFMALDGKPCQPLTSDQRVRVEEIHEGFYPDVLVSCPPEEFSPFDRNALTNPTLIVEVLSPSTRGYDKTQKFGAYSLLPSLRDLVFLEPDFVCLEHYHRESPQDEWRYRVYYKRTDVFTLEHLGVQLSLEEIYRNVDASEVLTLPLENSDK